MFRRLLSWLAPILSLLSLVPFVYLRPEAAMADGPALVYVSLAAPDALSRFRASGLPAYAHLQGREEEYLLAGADAAGRSRLASMGLTVRVLDADPGTASYFLVLPPRAQPRPEWELYGRLLLDDGFQVLLRAAPADAERLAALGAEIAYLELRPISLEPRPVAMAPTTIQPDTLVAQMLAQVQTATLNQYEKWLTGVQPVTVGGSPYTILTRHTSSGTSIQKATQFAYEHFQSLGLDVAYHNWNLSGYSGRNVIAELPGEISPDDVLIICAHIDDMPSGAVAPGADDNASGSVGVLVAADILSQYRWGCTLRFALWSGEEQGLLGSKVYAQQAAAAGEDILGVLNMDMIAYNSDANPNLDLYARSNVPGSTAIANLFADVIDAYDLDLDPDIFIDATLGNYSDNKSFWDQGYAAILAIEDDDDFTPYYHTTGDTLSTLNMSYFTEFVRASLGTFAHMGCLMPAEVGYLDGTVTAADSGAPLSGVTVAATDAAGDEFSTVSNASGYYTRTLTTGLYTVTATAYGYLPAVIPGISIFTNTVTHQDIALQPAASWVVSGTVREAGSGIPLPAEISFQSAPVTATADLWSGFYAATIPQGAYTMHVQAQGHRPVDRAVVIDRDQTQDFVLDPLPCILLVDDDNNSPDVRPYYSAALDALGYSYDVFDVGGGSGNGPSLEAMAGYRHVFWFSGDQYSSGTPKAGPSAADEAALAAYLQGGGRLFLSSQDYLYDRGLTSFAQTFLGVAGYTNDQGDATQMVGMAGDPIGGGLGPYPLAYPPGFTDYGDILYVGPGASVAFRSSANGNQLVLDKDGGSWRTVFFGTSWVPIYYANAANGRQVLERVLEWFGGCGAETGQLQGQVVDELDGTPLAGVALTIEPQVLPPQFTDPNGSYTMTLPAGYYTLTAAREEYITETVSGLLVLPGQSTTRDLTLRRERVYFYLPLVLLQP